MYIEGDPVIECSVVLNRSLQDMLLQSWGNKINIFPAVPTIWKDAVFHDLRAEGAFLVSANRKDGNTEWVRVKSLAGEPCRVQAVFASTPEIRINGQAVQLQPAANGVFELPLKKDDEALLFTGGQANPIVKPVPMIEQNANPWGDSKRAARQTVFNFGNEPVRYLENSRMKLGVNLEVGGAVTYPSNMLYAAALDSAARIYQKQEWLEKAASLRGKINGQSFDGTYYRDHAKRQPDGKLAVQPERTEVCQYYAFFFNTTTPQKRPELWKSLVTEFGPSRRETKAHPEIFPCNQLPGNMLRMEILSRYGETARIHDEALGYWQMMTEPTGTLWEHDKPEASCNHGFASHAAVVLRRDILGLREIDHRAKTVTFAMPKHPLEHCRGSFPTADGNITVEWKRDQEKPKLTLPEGWRQIAAP
jgi:hypothetical protein